MATTELDKMLTSQPYRAADPALTALRLAAQRQLYRFNHSSPEEPDQRQQILRSLFGQLGPGFEINPPFHCDYGRHIQAGRNLYINVNCTILDCHWVTFGHNVLIAPNVQIYTAYHPTDPALRQTGLEMAAPITLGHNVWVGGGAIICPGVTIGDHTTVGAGSVVTKSLPAGVVAAGNPCRIIRTVDHQPIGESYPKDQNW